LDGGAFLFDAFDASCITGLLSAAEFARPCFAMMMRLLAKFPFFFGLPSLLRLKKSVRR
jgi:hypothetical protein